MLAVSVTHHRCDLSLASCVGRLLLQPMINEPRSWQVAPRNSGIVSVHGLFPECIFFFFGRTRTRPQHVCLFLSFRKSGYGDTRVCEAKCLCRFLGVLAWQVAPEDRA